MGLTRGTYDLNYGRERGAKMWAKRQERTAGRERNFQYKQQQVKEKRQRDWEELTGSRSKVPAEYTFEGSSKGGFERQALEYKRKQQELSRQKFKESFEEEEWRNNYRASRTKQQQQQQQPSLAYRRAMQQQQQQQRQQMDNVGFADPNWRNNASPSMQNTSLIPSGATNTPYNTQNTFKPMNPMAFLNNYNGSKSSGSMGPRAQMQSPFQF